MHIIFYTFGHLNANINKIYNNMNYHCDICGYNCIYESHWLKHIKTKSHNNNI